MILPILIENVTIRFNPSVKGLSVQDSQQLKGFPTVSRFVPCVSLSQLTAGHLGNSPGIQLMTESAGSHFGVSFGNKLCFVFKLFLAPFLEPHMGISQNWGPVPLGRWCPLGFSLKPIQQIVIRSLHMSCLGPPVVPFLTPFLGEGSPTKIDYRKKGTLILTEGVVMGAEFFQIPGG